MHLNKVKIKNKIRDIDKYVQIRFWSWIFKGDTVYTVIIKAYFIFKMSIKFLIFRTLQDLQQRKFFYQEGLFKFFGYKNRFSQKTFECTV